MVGRSHHLELVVKLGVFIVILHMDGLYQFPLHMVLGMGDDLSSKGTSGHSLWQTPVTAALLHALWMLSLGVKLSQRLNYLLNLPPYWPEQFCI